MPKFSPECWCCGILKVILHIHEIVPTIENAYSQASHGLIQTNIFWPFSERKLVKNNWHNIIDIFLIFK